MEYTAHTRHATHRNIRARAPLVPGRGRQALAVARGILLLFDCRVVWLPLVQHLPASFRIPLCRSVSESRRKIGCHGGERLAEFRESALEQSALWADDA